MEQEKAEKFRGQYFPMTFDGGNTQKPESYKKIRIELIGDVELQKVPELSCHACTNFIGRDKEDLSQHIKTNHLNQQEAFDQMLQNSGMKVTEKKTA